MLARLINYHYITLFLAVLLGIKLYAQKQSRDVELRYYWLTLICCLLLVVQDVAEAYAALDPALRFWRILFSVMGYVLRPVTGVGLLLVICPPRFRTWKVWIPCMVNAAVNLTAFFSPLAFYFDESYAFARGPLGYVVFIVSFLYMIAILSMMRGRFYEGKTAERWILVACGLGCVGATAVDVVYGGTHVQEAIMIAGVFLLVYLRSHDNNTDPLTSLRNRFAFYEDCDALKKDVSAAAAIDMNGLKELNDAKGHDEGDRALAAIGECLSAVSDRSVLAYRVGGDEFTLLFLRRGEDAVRETLRRIDEGVTAAGYSVAAGYAMAENGRALADTLREADQRMYENKAAYYMSSGKDRRTRRGG